LVEELAVLAPHTTVHFVEGVTFAGTAMDTYRWHGLDQAPWALPVQLMDSDTCERALFPNPSPIRKRFETFTGPAILATADLAISVAPLKRTILHDEPLISGTVKNFFGLLPRDVYKARSLHSRGLLHRPSVHVVLTEVAKTFLPHFHYGIVDLDHWFDSPDWHPDKGKSIPCGKIVAGTDLPTVDRAACACAGILATGYLSQLS
jgi:uncharacterized protein (DUF362 family)